MKALFTLIFKTLLLSCIALSAKSQGAESNQEGSKIFIKIPNPGLFYEVNESFELENDTLFLTNSGFRVNPDFYEIIVGDEPYLVFTYPSFDEGSKPSTQPRPAVAALGAGKAVRAWLKDFNGKTIAIKKKDYESLKPVNAYSISLRYISLMGGQLTVPFKFRPKLDDETDFQMTTDVTLGAYIGFRQRISRSNPYFITVPAVLGLSFINISDNTTTPTTPTETTSSITPGISWSSGLIFQLDKFNAGVVFGRDYASGVGSNWKYQGKTWWSFAIGYAFVR